MNILECFKIYNSIMSLRIPLEDKVNILKQKLLQKEIDKVTELMEKIHERNNQMGLFEFLNQFPQQEL